MAEGWPHKTVCSLEFSVCSPIYSVLTSSPFIWIQGRQPSAGRREQSRRQEASCEAEGAAPLSAWRVSSSASGAFLVALGIAASVARSVCGVGIWENIFFSES